MDIFNKHIVITGAGSGLGAATALYLKEKGAKLTLLDLNETTLKNNANKLDSPYKGCDVSDAQSGEHAIAYALEKNGDIHGLINCAGIAPGARIVGREGPQALETFSKAISVNLMGSFNMMRLCADAMMKQDTLNHDGERGVIINTASIAAYEGQIGQASYAASKAGVVGMTLPAAREFSKFGIRVVTIAPGLMETPMLSGMPEDVYESLIASTLFPKRLGSGKEYAKLALSILENPLLNGETIRLDGAIRLAPK